MKIFISYHISNKVFVDKLLEALKQIGVAPVINNLQLMYGDQIYDNLDQALKNCDQIIMVLSKSYIKSKWLQKESFAFLMKEREMRTNFILPIVVGDCDVPAILENKVIDFGRMPFNVAFNLLSARISKTRQVFVVMKFGDKTLDSAYEGAIKRVIEEFKYSPLRIDEIDDSGSITDQILNQVARSEIVLADLTGERPNCYYEAGFAHALEKEMIFTILKPNKPHFDLAIYRFIEWETEEDLRVQLRKRFMAIQKRLAKAVNAAPPSASAA
jgi:TIR domain